MILESIVEKDVMVVISYSSVVGSSTLIWHFNFGLLKLHMFWNIMKNIDGIQWLHKAKTHQQNHTILELILMCMCEQGIEKTIDSLGDTRNKEMKQQMIKPPSYTCKLCIECNKFQFRRERIILKWCKKETNVQVTCVL